ncbi:MAG: Sigma-54-dependent Fis family transcriptional regulator [Candidatus Acidoferrum typicum]|nr:Sigma-54-dependent Fis family transcriptional regulator [Candidatus Acidoferrum typicum]
MTLGKKENESSAPANDIVLRLLIVDDDLDNLALMRQVFENEPVEVFVTGDTSEGLDLFRTKRPQIVTLALLMPQMGGMEMMANILAIDPGVDVILITRHYSTDAAVEAIKKGAYDYLTKPISVARFRETLRELLSHAQLRQHSQELEGEMIDAFQFEGMIGRSPLMLDLFRKINRVARHFRTILLIGETGTGKELAAKALHRLGPRPTSPFITANCSAWAESLLETELFGCVKGAFTGATQDRKGVFEYANGGTLFLDEIGDMPVSSQSKLLRVLQNQEIQRVGSPIVHKVDVRVIAASSRDLHVMVAENKFRQDLYYRLSMMEIQVPRLADRREDLPLLERYMVHSFAVQSNKQIRGLTRRAQAVLSRYSWPGNVRELENVIGHGCIMAEGGIIDIHNLPEYLRILQHSATVDAGEKEIVSLMEMTQRYTREVVDRIHNKAQAAHLLGISRTKLYRLLSKKQIGESDKIG